MGKKSLLDIFDDLMKDGTFNQIFDDFPKEHNLTEKEFLKIYNDWEDSGRGPYRVAYTPNKVQ